MISKLKRWWAAYRRFALAAAIAFDGPTIMAYHHGHALRAAGLPSPFLDWLEDEMWEKP